MLQKFQAFGLRKTRYFRGWEDLPRSKYRQGGLALLSVGMAPGPLWGRHGGDVWSYDNNDATLRRPSTFQLQAEFAWMISLAPSSGPGRKVGARVVSLVWLRGKWGSEGCDWSQVQLWNRTYGLSYQSQSCPLFPSSLPSACVTRPLWATPWTGTRGFSDLPWHLAHKAHFLI